MAVMCHLHENAQLPCGHGLCECCEKRWVARKLTCPFCRERFVSAKQLARQGWNITEFHVDQLDKDIQSTQDQINKAWEEVTEWRQMQSQGANHESETIFVELPLHLCETTQESQHDFELINDSK